MSLSSIRNIPITYTEVGDIYFECACIAMQNDRLLLRDCDSTLRITPVYSAEPSNGMTLDACDMHLLGIAVCSDQSNTNEVWHDKKRLCFMQPDRVSLWAICIRAW